MSTQDPYGTPPQQPYGQQPPGQQPYGQGPGQQPYGAPGFGTGPGYPPPPPPKKGTGLVIGAILAALVLIGGAVTAVVLLTGDDDDKADSSSEKAEDDATDDPTDEPTEDPSDEPTDEPSDDPTIDAGTIAGTNYTYSLPDEQWIDATAAAAQAGTVVDSVAAWGQELQGSRANVIVEAGSATGELEDERAGWESNLNAGGSALERLPDVEIDGEPAYAVQLQGTNDSGTEVFQTVYLTIHQEIVYSIGFSSEPAADEAAAGFDVVKASWAWTS